MLALWAWCGAAGNAADQSTVLVAGATGQTGSHIVARLKEDGYTVRAFVRDLEKAREKLGWVPKTTFQELVTEMVREDLKTAERDELIKTHGYKTMDYHE